MNKELETIIENEFDCLINDLGCLIGEEWKAESIKKVVNQAFVLGGVSNCAIKMPEILDEAIRREANYAVQYADYSLETWTVASKLNDRRKDNLLTDGSVRKVRLEYEM